jgi:acetyl-CoA carboxylase carboxyl transferase subunit alpha
LWRSWDYKEKAAEALKLTPADMKKNNLIDKIIAEPLGGAHRDREKTFNNVKNAILQSFNSLKEKKIDSLIKERTEKFVSMGVYNS